MKFHKLDSYYIVTDIKEHKELKNNLLKYIEEMPQSNIDDGYVVVSKTDWNIPSDYKRDYMNLFFNIIKPYMEEMACKLKFTGYGETLKGCNLNFPDFDWLKSGLNGDEKALKNYFRPFDKVEEYTTTSRQILKDCQK